MFYNARYYDPALGRFAQADTIVPGGFQGLDRYSYVNNNPLRYTDPAGHLPRDKWIELYGKDYVKALESILPKKKLDFLYSSSFSYGNIITIGNSDGDQTAYLFGISQDGDLSFINLATHESMDGKDFVDVFYDSKVTKWNAYVRQSPPDNNKMDYFAGGYRMAQSDQCPTCDSTMVYDWKSAISDITPYVTVKNEYDPLTVSAGVATYLGGIVAPTVGLGAFVAGCFPGPQVVFSAGGTCYVGAIAGVAGLAGGYAGITIGSQMIFNDSIIDSTLYINK